MALSRRAKVGLALALVAGAALRLYCLSDMEYKYDERWMFERTVNVGTTEPFPWLGMPSGVSVRNPGMSVWVFLGLSRLLSADEPVRLALGVVLLNLAALVLGLVYAIRRVPAEEREPWLWAIGLVALNPLAVIYSRKIWVCSPLPFFSMLFLFAWSRRENRAGAFFWGLVGACLGQIHMSGFFYAFAFAAWDLFLGSYREKKTRWRWWTLGSAAGALPLVPWVAYFFDARSPSVSYMSWDQLLQSRFLGFWVSDPLGLHVGNSLGAKLGNSLLVQISDFLRYPMVGGEPTWLMAAAHAFLLAAGALAIANGFHFLHSKSRRRLDVTLGTVSDSLFTQRAALISYGFILTLSTIMIRRIYLIITFPLEFVWLAGLCLRPGFAGRWGRGLLLAIAVVELAVSVTFLHYIHVNGGAENGDYGRSYRAQAGGD